MSVIQGLTKAIVYVKDMNAQVRFYRDVLDLKIQEPADLESYSNEIWVEFATGGCNLVLHADTEKRLGQDRPKLVFSVNDMETAHKTLTERGAKLSNIRSRLPGLKVADGFDPENNPFSIYSQK
ncbi:VOC family protein [Nostoc sp. CHAB 5824]|nr:VOC family protein [Nostoc sp. CHAB 5824]